MGERTHHAKVLFFAANPQGTTPLALDEELRDIEHRIRASEHRDSLSLRSRWAVRADDLIQGLLEDKPTIVHFSGHGEGVEGLVLHSDKGPYQAVNAEGLRALFETLKDDIRVVVLNACYSREQAEVIREVIDCVVGMNAPIGDDSARKFAAAFYTGLGFGRSVEVAFNLGVTAIKLEGFKDGAVPELLLREGVDANQVFVLNPQ